MSAPTTPPPTRRSPRKPAWGQEAYSLAKENEKKLRRLFAERLHAVPTRDEHLWAMFKTRRKAWGAASKPSSIAGGSGGATGLSNATSSVCGADPVEVSPSRRVRILGKEGGRRRGQGGVLEDVMEERGKRDVSVGAGVVVGSSAGGSGWGERGAGGGVGHVGWNRLSDEEILRLLDSSIPC